MLLRIFWMLEIRLVLPRRAVFVSGASVRRSATRPHHIAPNSFRGPRFARTPPRGRSPVLQNLNAARTPAEMVTLASVARRLNRAAPTLVRWAEAGEFPRFVIVNGRRYVFEADVHAWLEARRATIAHEHAA